MRYAIPLLLAGASFVWGQAPAFEVASIKKATVETGRFQNMTGCFSTPPVSEPGIYTCINATVELMAFQAYGLKQYQLNGVNDDKDKYTVRAKIPHGASNARVAPGATKEQFKPMLQNLLAGRFKLAFHRQPKEFPVYELTIVAGGAKLRPTLYPDATPSSPGEAQMQTGTDGYPVLLAGKRAGQCAVRSGLSLCSYQAQPVSTLVFLLGMYLGNMTGPVIWAPGRVIDRTGLTGSYDFRLTHTPALGIGAYQPMSPDPSATPNNLPGLQEPGAGPDLIKAMEEQLGLKVTRGKATFDVLVIDHAERVPVEN